MDRQVLKQVLIDQRKLFEERERIVDREVELDWFLKGNEAVVISGIRRCGKSTLLKILADRIGPPYIFVDFDDLRLVDFSIDDFPKIESLALEMSGLDRPVYFLDEVQNVASWDRWIADLYKKGIKVVVTGSNSKLLGPEISTHLTGRNKTLVMYPFSFREFLDMNGSKPRPDPTTSEKDAIRSLFSSYLRKGGFPLVVKNDDILLSRQYLEDILNRDIIARYKIRQIRELKEMIVYILTNSGSVIPISSIQKISGLKSPSTVARFMEYLVGAFLVFRVSRFDYSVKRQTPQKFYSADPSFLETSAFNTSDNLGKRLENIVAIELKRKGKEIYYHRVKRECDFIVKEGLKISQAIQVTLSLDDPRVRKRETEGLEEAMRTYGLKEGLILTSDTMTVIDSECGKITVRPIWEWLLD